MNVIARDKTWRRISSEAPRTARPPVLLLLRPDMNPALRCVCSTPVDANLVLGLLAPSRFVGRAGLKVDVEVRFRYCGWNSGLKLLPRRDPSPTGHTWAGVT